MCFLFEKKKPDMKVFCSLFLLVGLYVKFIAALLNWFYFEGNPISVYFSLLGFVLVICCLILMVIVWSRLCDKVLKRTERAMLKSIIGLCYVGFQLVFFVIFTLIFLVLSLLISLTVFYKWMVLAMVVFVAFNFLTIAIGFIVFGIQTFLALRKADPSISATSLKFTRFMFIISIVFVSFAFWEVLFVIDLFCQCILTFSFYSWPVFQVHEILIYVLMSYLLLDTRIYKLWIKQIYQKISKKGDK